MLYASIMLSVIGCLVSFSIGYFSAIRSDDEHYGKEQEQEWRAFPGIVNVTRCLAQLWSLLIKQGKGKLMQRVLVSYYR